MSAGTDEEGGHRHGFESNHPVCLKVLPSPAVRPRAWRGLQNERRAKAPLNINGTPPPLPQRNLLQWMQDFFHGNKVILPIRCAEAPTKLSSTSG